jgi:hypothetical protein
MSKEIMSANGEHYRYYGKVYQKYNAWLRGNFLRQLGDDSEVDECVQKTFDYLFLYMEDRCWEAEKKLIGYRLRMIAGGVCSKKLAERRARPANGSNCQEKARLLDKIRREVLRPISERMEFKQMFLRIFGRAKHPRLKQLSAYR